MVDLKPHNLETYERIKEIFKIKNRACCVQPTGSGKSYLALTLFEDNPSARKLVLEPQHYIREQLQSKVTEDMGEVQFITYSKLAKMSDEDIGALEPDIIVLDEFHRAGAKEWGGKGVQRLLESYPESKVLGLSATPIRYLDNGRNMAEELFGGAMVNNMSLAEAIVQRVLPMPRYICGLYCLDGEVESINKKIEQSYNNLEEKKTLLKQVQEMKKQLDRSNGVSSIFRKYILEPNGKYIVFCKDIKHLNQMQPMLEQWFVEAGFKNVRMYIVHSKNENKDAEFIKFKEDDGEGIRLCLTVSMLNEGVHVDGIDGVIMLRNTISAGLFFQQIGRAISCNSKGIPLILDLVANAQSVTECNLKMDIEREILKERDRNKGFSDEGLEIDKFFIMDEVMDGISAFKGIEGRLVDSWDIYIKALEQYKAREGDCFVPGKYVEEIEDGLKVNLGYWVARMRLIKENNLLTNEKIIKLNKLGFCWNQKKEPFFTFIKYLTEYKECNHHCDIKNNESFNGYPIGKKFSNYVYRYKHSMLDKSDCMMLENVLGTVKDRYEITHERNCELANECISESNIISKKNRKYKNIDLYEWVTGTLRRRYEIGKLTQLEQDMVRSLVGYGIEEIGKRIRKPVSVKVIQKSNHQLIGIYQTIKEASRAIYNELGIKISESIIGRSLKGKRKNEYAGLIFQYAANNDTELKI